MMRARREVDSYYNDGALYDALYGHQGDVEFYVEEAARSEGPVLELACGTGRLTLPVAATGVAIEGMDLSTSMLAQARVKAPRLKWLQGDMRNFSLDQHYGLIFVGGNSLQHLHAYQDVGRFCDSVRRHLLPRGKLILSVFNPSLEMLVSPDTRRLVTQIEDPQGRGTLAVEERRRYDRSTQVLHSTWYFSLPEAPDFDVKDLSLRCFYPQELMALLTLNGLTVEQRYGDFARTPFTSEHTWQILTCRVGAR